MEEGRSDREEKLDQQQPRRTVANNHHHQQQPPRKCPRCDSSNTKFCYYNNYSLAQPRYICKACRRYWTHGGTLRNVPVGGGCRKGRRQRPSVSSNSSRSGTARTRSLSPAIPSRNSTGMIPTESSIGAFPSMGNSFNSGGGFLSSLTAAAQAAPPPDRAGHGAFVNLGGGNSHYGGNNDIALLQEINLTSMMSSPAPPHQFQARNGFLTSQSSLNDNSPRALASFFTQSFIERSDTSANSSAGFWSGAADNQLGSSFNPNQWSDHNHHGFPPPQ